MVYKWIDNSAKKSGGYAKLAENQPCRCDVVSLDSMHDVANEGRQPASVHRPQEQTQRPDCLDLARPALEGRVIIGLKEKFS